MDEPDITTEVVPIADVIGRMRQSGFSPDLIASTLNLPAIQVRAILVQHRTLSPEEQDIADATRKLIMRGVKQAMKVLDMGTRAEQMAIIMRTLSLAGRTLAKTDETDVVEGRAVLSKLYEMMRDGDGPIDTTTIIPDADGD